MLYTPGVGKLVYFQWMATQGLKEAILLYRNSSPTAHLIEFIRVALQHIPALYLERNVHRRRLGFM